MNSLTLDGLVAWLQSLIRLTEGLSAQLASDEIAPIEQLVERRDALLSEQNKWFEEWKDLINSADNNAETLSDLKVLVTKLSQVDEDLVALVVQKKNKLAEQLKQAQNQKLLLAYST